MSRVSPAVRPSRFLAPTLVGLLGVTTTAHADGWLVVETPVAIATSDAQASTFRAGVMPAIGAYIENRFALGVRVRGGVLRDGPAPTGGLADPGVGGLTTASIAMRVSVRGGWLELAAGGGITGRDVVPAVEAGVGWAFGVGSIELGPSARYVRVISNDKMDAFGSAGLALIGIDVRFGRKRRTITREPVVMPRVEPVARIEPVTSDADRAIDRDDGCTVDATGCPAVAIELAEDIVMQDDRIVLDERVLFALNRARVRSGGRVVLSRLAQVWRDHPEWKRITVEGHADVRGTDAYNQWLSEQRAQRVKAKLVELGCPPDHITVIGHGRSRPREVGANENAHERNRRVEFVIDRSVP
jgi:outer membrane protein OmpA-like peptidoglycan-associated protein